VVRRPRKALPPTDRRFAVVVLRLRTFLILLYRRLFYLWSRNGCYRSCESHTLVHSRHNAYIGQVERGIANKGDEVEVVGLGSTFKTTLTGIGALFFLY
jgi:hypothetical protein